MEIVWEYVVRGVLDVFFTADGDFVEGYYLVGLLARALLRDAAMGHRTDGLDQSLGDGLPHLAEGHVLVVRTLEPNHRGGGEGKGRVRGSRSRWGRR